MAYRHGVTVSEVPTALISPVTSLAGLTVAFGTAPVNMVSTASVNEPILAYSYAEAVSKLGFVPANENGIFDFTLCEVIDCFFSKNNVAPIVLVNVLDPESHNTEVEAEAVTITAKVGKLSRAGVMPSTVVIRNGESDLVPGTDYTMTFDQQGKLVISLVSAAITSVNATYSYLNTSSVTVSDIVGGIDPSTSARKGLELIDEVFPRTRLIPGTVIAPGYSTASSVAAVMKAKVKNVSGVFKAIALCDLDTTTIDAYTKAPAAKENAGYSDTHLTVCWPKVSLGGVQYHLSTQLAAIMQLTDAVNNDTPYASPSNKSLAANNATLKNGRSVYLTPDEAEYLNSNGIVSALNFIGGWRAWGNETSAFPGTSDVKDRFIAVRRMFNWVGNTLVSTFWSRLDWPMNQRQIETVQNSANDWLNSLVSQGYLLAARTEFLRVDNPNSALLAGQSVFRVFITVPTPNGDIEFKLEYDVDGLQTLFGGQ